MTDTPWVLKRTDARGGYVARDPAAGVTFHLADARHFTREEVALLAAHNEIAHDEIPCPVSALLAGFPL